MTAHVNEVGIVFRFESPNRPGYRHSGEAEERRYLVQRRFVQ